MFCSRCGKKVLDSMLFCPFCGSEIIIPEQEAAEAAGVDVSAAGEVQPESAERSAVGPVEAFSFDSEPEDDAGRFGTEPPAEPEFATEPEPVSEPEAAPVTRWDDEDEDFFKDDDDGFDDAAYMRSASAKAAQREAPRQEKARPAQRRPEGKSTEVGVPEMRRRAPKAEASREDAANERRGSARASRAASASSDRDAARQRRSPKTIAPAKTENPDDMFMDDVADADETFDSYDAYDDAFEAEYDLRRAPDDFDDEDDDEDYDDDDDRGGFLMRHMRGVVGIILFLVLILLIVLYLLSDAGQTSLAHINAPLPLRPEIYSRLGYESYQAEDYRQAGVYYEHALSRDTSSYNYASSAAMSYIAANDTEKAAAMLKRCIEINPLAVEPYVFLAKLYPDASSRPWEITQLIQQGYQTTGDSRLNVN